MGAYPLAAQDVADISENGATAEETAEGFEGTPIESIRAILSYYYANKHEVVRSR